MGKKNSECPCRPEEIYTILPITNYYHRVQARGAEARSSCTSTTTTTK